MGGLGAMCGEPGFEPQDELTGPKEPRPAPDRAAHCKHMVNVVANLFAMTTIPVWWIPWC